MRTPQSKFVQELLTTWPPLSDIEEEGEGLFIDPATANRLNLPRELRAQHQWVVWRLGSDQNTIEYFNPRNGAPASVTEPETWGSCRQAQKALSRGYDGIALALTENDPYIGVYLPDCISSEGINEQARAIFNSLGSYSEYTDNQSGLLILVKGSLPPGDFSSENVELLKMTFCPISCHFVLGGRRVIKARQAKLDQMLAELFSVELAGADTPVSEPQEPALPLPATKSAPQAATLAPSFVEAEPDVTASRQFFSARLPIAVPFPIGLSIPQEMTSLPQWTLLSSRKGSASEPFLCPLNEVASTDSPSDGSVFVFNANTPLIAIELADCLDEKGRLTVQADSIVKQLDSYSAFTLNGDGIQIIIRGSLPAGEWERGNIKVYSLSGQLNMSGIHFTGTRLTICERQEQIGRLFADLFPIDASALAVGERAQEGAGDESLTTGSVPSDDAQIHDSAQVQDTAQIQDTVQIQDTAQIQQSATPSELTELTTSRPTELITSSQTDESTDIQQLVQELLRLALTELNWKRLCGRTRPTDFRAFIVILHLMLEANSLTLSLSSRELAWRAGVTRRTASKILKRLCKMGLLTLVNKSEHAPHIPTARKRIQAHRYRLVIASDLKQKLADYLLEEPHAEPTISSDVLLNYAGHDAFMHGAKLLISGHNSLGPTALEVLAALVAEAEKENLDTQNHKTSGLSFAELARRSNVSASTVAKKVRAFENMGLLSIKKEGRCQKVRLLNLHGWQKQLESKRQQLNTNGRAEARQGSVSSKQ